MKRTADLTAAFGAPPERRERIKSAILVFGLVAGAALVAVTPINDFLLAGTYIAGNHFPIGAFSVLLFLTLFLVYISGSSTLPNTFALDRRLNVWNTKPTFLFLIAASSLSLSLPTSTLSSL